MPVEIDRASLVKSARGYGSRGAAMPDWAKGDPQLEAAYNDGAGVTPEPEPEDTPKPATSGPKPPPRQRRPAPTSSGTGRRKGGNGKGFWSSPAYYASGAALTPGSFGGVLIAVFVYPVVLAFIEAGPAGAGQWIAAKFINKGAGSSGVAPSSTPAPSSSPYGKTGAAGSPKVAGPNVGR